MDLDIDLPFYNTPLIDARGNMSEVWWRFFTTLLARTGGTQGVDINNIVILINDLFNLLQDQSINTGVADNKATQVGDLLQALARALEFNASRPAFQLPRSFSIDYLDMDPLPAYAGQTARLAWNSVDDTLNIHHSGGVTQQVGAETYVRFLNTTGSTFINGTCVGVNTATSAIVPFIGNGTLAPMGIVGVATQDIPNGTSGRLTTFGRVNEIDTSGAPYGEVWANGDLLYVSTTVAGGLTNSKPTAPNVSIPMGRVVLAAAGPNGIIFVRPLPEQQLYYGQFSKTVDQAPSAINTANAITWTGTLVANGVTIGAPTSRIVVAHAGLYRFSASFQLTSGSASVKNVWLWYRKNGVDIPDSALKTSMDSGTAIRAPSRSLLIPLAANDYIEHFWAADDVNVTLDAIAATGFAPGAPAALLTVQQEQQ